MATESDIGITPAWIGPLRGAIEGSTATVGIVGLGYVGLPLMLAVSDAGYPVVGVDIDPERISAVRSGQSYVIDVPDVALSGLSPSSVTEDHRRLAGADVILIAVATPLTDGVPDLSAIRQASAEVAAVLSPGRLVVLESTTYPGTTEELVRPILERSGLVAGEDFLLAYSPERIDPGTSRRVQDTPKLVAGLGPLDTEMARGFYERFVDVVVTTSSPREAEMAKLIENTFRHVNIALINELAMLASDLGVDIWESIEAAATKPFGFMPFWPGTGVGGHCIAIDPSFLSWRVGQRLGFGIGFVEHANEVNKRMPQYVVTRIAEALNDVGKPIRGSRILALGVTYKPGVNDVRESPAMRVLERLAGAGADCSYHDPYAPAVELVGRRLASQPLDPELLEVVDCVTILTAHPDVNYEAVLRSARLVFDARGVFRGSKHPNVVRL